MYKDIKLPEIPEAERRPLVDQLIGLIQALAETAQRQAEEIAQLKDEIAVLKKQKKRPKLRPSKMDEETDAAGDQDQKTSKRGTSSQTSKKTKDLKIHETQVVKAEGVPEGAAFKGYQDFVVQDLQFQPNNTCYRLEQWVGADGKYVIADPPANGHYGPTLVSFVLHQYYHQHVTQPLLLEQLKALGFKISAGTLNTLLTEDKALFHQEKAALLEAGKAVSRYLQTDDTGARHQGKNGYCTYIGNDLFAWFESTSSKSRINFLSLLRAGHDDYVINAGALDYLRHQRLPSAKIELLETARETVFANHTAWQAHLAALGIRGKRHTAIATEGALMGSLLAHGLSPEIAIVSDDAGQFNVFHHALCWIHAERLIHRLIPLNDEQRQAQQQVREQIWALYADLKRYKAAPDQGLKDELLARFEALCATRTCFETLNQALKRLHKNQSELLLILEKPWLPLHNNLSENDIRDYVKKRKISGSTRSELGRQCRDTFASLKKTCRKHAISFWDFLQDRVSGKNALPPLPELVRRAAHVSPQ